jgi:hypothetical protein
VERIAFERSIPRRCNLALFTGPPALYRRRMTESTCRIEGATGAWQVVVGLEVHAQVTSKVQLFSGASTQFGAEPNG